VIEVVRCLVGELTTEIITATRPREPNRCVFSLCSPERSRGSRTYVSYFAILTPPFHCETGHRAMHSIMLVAESQTRNRREPEQE
jgi:hypothetical protein